MKLFSRKGLVAAAASAALVTGTMVAPANAETADSDVSVVASGSSDFLTSLSLDEEIEEQPAEEEEPAEDPKPEGDGEPGDGDDGGTGDGENNNGGNNDDDTTNGSSDPDTVTSWIGVFTAIIGALSAVFSFVGNF